MNGHAELSAIEWVKSSYSNTDGGDCVEWAPSIVTCGVVVVRDSKSPEGPHLLFGPRTWSSFVASLR
ncbi:DUF397 domain-containing protein [Streptomyces durbertensis]|uniref:DUF397 domain-containing protein n=1 Tax=Streptomyces durbertensis TaxID=2448886 RepID=A0ABR6ENB3_9ACTN|nr:DUF397 domain-containing protein [Streptomyces durbertensis]MBB1246843.1 DUF397 domain-containing protein [Streptomyces durbertensis]